jgi:hypothetical protein
MGLIVEAWAADVNRRGVLDESFLLGVAVEPHDGREAPTDRCPGSAELFEFAGKQLDLAAVHIEQPDAATFAPSEELAKVEGVGLPGATGVAG